jgi:hypothetical protein
VSASKCWSANLTLTLLVLFGRANHQHLTVPADDLAVFTALFDGCANFHLNLLINKVLWTPHHRRFSQKRLREAVA